MRQSLSGTRAAKLHPTAWSCSLSDTVLSSRSIALERGLYTKVPTDPQPRQATQHAGRWRLHANRSYGLRNSDHQQNRRDREPFDFSSIGSVGSRRYRTVRRSRKPVGDRIGMFWNGDISRRSQSPVTRQSAAPISAVSSSLSSSGSRHPSFAPAIGTHSETASSWAR